MSGTSNAGGRAYRVRPPASCCALYRILPGPAVRAAQQRGGFGVVGDRLLLRVPSDAPPQLERQHAQQRRGRRAVAGFDVARGGSLLLDRVDEVAPQVRDIVLVLAGKFRVLVDGWLLPVAREKRPAVVPAQVKRAIRAVEVHADRLVLARWVAGELAMLPRHREAVERVSSDLVIRRIARLLLRRVHRRTFDRSAAGR